MIDATVESNLPLAIIHTPAALLRRADPQFLPVNRDLEVLKSFSTA